VGSTERKIVSAAFIWPLVGLLAAVAVVAFLMTYVFGADPLVRRRKVVTLEMSWRRGDDHHGPNFVYLESRCLNNPVLGCFCANAFEATTTKEFADYVETFGNRKVPVLYEVKYVNGQVVGAGLLSVGTWPKSRFNASEISLVTGFKLPKLNGVMHSKNPADCFPPFGN
jgi:hypothetical protein